MIKHDIGKRIKELREYRGYSQESFANVCGLNRTYISGIESGKRNVSIENIEKIAKGLEVDKVELFKFSEPLHSTIIVNINGEEFLMKGDKNLDSNLKNYIESIAECFYEEDNDWYTDDIYDLSNYDLADLFQKAVKDNVGVNLSYKGIDLEVRIQED